MADETVQKELDHYQQRLDEMQRNTEDKISGTNKALVDQQVEIRAKMQAEVDAEKDMLIAKIDTDLADAVQSFLLETLQHNVDLGSQTTYLVSKLEEHKTEITKGLRHEI
jgi:F0F1-type ATP synthase membrane subunit b/b'